MIRKLEDLQGLKFDNSREPQVGELILQTVTLANKLALADVKDERALRLAAAASIQTANALLSSVAFKCILRTHRRCRVKAKC